MRNEMLITLAIGSVAFMAGCQHRFASGANVWTLDYRGRPFVEEQSFSEGRSGAGKGGSGPVMSHDRRQVAYTHKGDIWIRDLDSGSARQLTRTAQEKTETQVEVFNLVSSWAPDDTKLLAYLDHGSEQCDDCEGNELDVPTLSYGFRLVDTASGDEQFVDITPPAVGWLDSQRALFISDKHELSSYNVLSGRIGRHGDMPEQIGSANVSSDGRFLLFDEMSFEKEGSVSILQREIQSQVDRTVAGPSPIGTLGLPTFSPSDKRIGFLRRQGNTRQLVIDQRVVFECFENLNYSWVNSSKVAVQCGSRAHVVKVRSSEIVGRYVVEP